MGSGFFLKCFCEACGHSSGNITEKEVAVTATLTEKKQIKNLPLGGDKTFLPTFKTKMNWYKKSLPEM
jgi:hypothetical protein